MPVVFLTRSCFFVHVVAPGRRSPCSAGAVRKSHGEWTSETFFQLLLLHRRVSKLCQTQFSLRDIPLATRQPVSDTPVSARQHARKRKSNLQWMLCSVVFGCSRSAIRTNNNLPWSLSTGQNEHRVFWWRMVRCLIISHLQRRVMKNSETQALEAVYDDASRAWHQAAKGGGRHDDRDQWGRLIATSGAYAHAALTATGRMRGTATWTAGPRRSGCASV